MNTGLILESRGRYAEARAELEGALRAVSGSPRDRRAFLSRIELGSVAALAGRYVEAEDWDNDAVRLGVEMYGSESSEMAAPFTNLAALYRDQGRYRRAEEFAQRALKVVTNNPTADPARRAHVLGTLGGILARRGKLEEAAANLRQSIQIAERIPAAIETLAADRSNLAGVYAKTGRDAEALSLYRDASELIRRVGGTSDPRLFFILAGMAAVEAHSGHYAEAVGRIQEAIDQSASGAPAATLPLRDALLAEAEWLHNLKREGEARRVRAQARQVEKAVAGNSYSQYTVDARRGSNERDARAE